MQFNFTAFEKKWQQYWQDNQTFAANNNYNQPKYYVLDMFPYPSGAGLHVGHPLGYIASDIVARYKKLQGFNVLHPMGYDSFGLPAEQYAIQTGQHPAITTKVNIEGGTDKMGNTIAGYENQLKRLGLAVDWTREIRTSNPDYYRWTQWIFLQLFDSYYCNNAQKAQPINLLIKEFTTNGNLAINAVSDDSTPSFTAQEWNTSTTSKKEEILLHYRLAYLAEAEVNWCPALGTVLANDEVVNGVSERGGHPVVRKKMTQWMMRISAYAQRLLKGIDDDKESLDISDSLRDIQKNWIGKSKGASLEFNIQNSDKKIEVFTTRPDTIFGVSFMVLAPEHNWVAEITTPDKKNAVNQYIAETTKRSERERIADVKSISGEFTGAYALHPFTGKEIPIWIADYVLASYGTGAVMAVPAGDDRDHAFAKHFNLPIPSIFKGIDVANEAFTQKDTSTTLQHSDFLDNLSIPEATNKILHQIEQQGIGKATINYRLRDAVFSRQRYWGEPVPIYFNNGIPCPIPEDCLPLELPPIDEYLPTESGEPPLGRATHWAWDTNKLTVVSNQEIDQQSVFPLELNTMPGWAGSSWYMFRYMDAQNNQAFASKDALDYWQQVDLYLGGSEHATGHLLYTRFWTKFLYDRGFITVDEPFKKLINQGMIQGRSAFVMRKIGEKALHSYHNDLNINEFDKIHVDISLIDESDDSLNLIAFKQWRPEYADAQFLTDEDGKFYVHREVEKMSKSKYNVINPDDICKEYGADTLRMYEMFLGPLEQSKPWNTQGLSGVHNFLKKLWKLFFDENNQLKITEYTPTKQELKVLHQTIKKVNEDIEAFSFNTSVSTFMIAVNELGKTKCTNKRVLEDLLIILSPFAPHICEELWQATGNQESISNAHLPAFNPAYLAESTKEYPISFNGKVRLKIEFSLDDDKDEITAAVLADERVQNQLQGATPKKIIVVPGKIVNIVC